MTVEDLLRPLDRLDYHERLGALLAHARTLSASDAASLMRALSSGDVSRRRLALYVAQLRRDVETLEQALDDASLSVRVLAAKFVGRHSTTLSASVIDRLDAHSLGVLLREVVRCKRTQVAETLVAGLLTRERLREAASLLGTCSPEAIRRWLNAAAWPETLWVRLAKRHPSLMVTHIEPLFSSSRSDNVWGRFDASVWAALARTAPGAVRTWLDQHGEADGLPNTLLPALPHLVRHSPVWAVQLLASRSAWLVRHKLPAGLTQRLRQVDDAVLTPLYRGLIRAAPELFAELIARLPYPRRASAFALATEPLELARIEWPSALLKVLPGSIRDAEAKRLLSLTRAQTDSSWRRELLGLCDVAHARPSLASEGRAAQATDRAEAHAALIRSTRRSRTGMHETLTALQSRMANEQDPVRLAVFTALAEVPGQRFDNPELLNGVLAPAFDARDTSWGTRSQIAKIAHRLMIAHATQPTSPLFALGLSLLERLAGQAGTPDLPRLDRNLPRGAELAIVTALRPWAEAAEKRQQEYHVQRLWTALGKRAWRVPQLSEMLERMLWRGRKENASWIALLWLQDPKTRDERVRAMVQRDRSALYLRPVLDHCHQRRQSLLVGRFTGSAPRGRFHDGKVVVVPTFTGGFQRWTTELQTQYVQLLRQAETEPKRFSQTRAQLIAQRSRVPVTRVSDLRSALESTEVTTQEAALGALVWLDDPAPALPLLLQHVDGERARVAMYAMPRLARLLPRERIVEALAALLARPRLKVTVHKEVLRLLGQLGTPRAIALVRASWSQPLHRDVRIAALHAARSLLRETEAWSLLTEAAGDPDPDMARALVEVPVATVAGAHRARYLEVMALVAEHPQPSARLALFNALRAGWSLAGPSVAVELGARVLQRLDPTDPWQSAVRVVADGARAREDHLTLEELVAELATSADRDVAPAGERDRCAHQRLVAVTEALLAQRQPAALELLAQLSLSLLAQPHWWSLGARLRVAAAPNAQLGKVSAELFFSAPTPSLRQGVVEAAQAAAQLDARDWQSDDAAQVLADLRAEAAALVSVAVLAAFGRRWGWNAEWEGELAQLRNHADLDVLLAARRLWLV